MIWQYKKRSFWIQTESSLLICQYTIKINLFDMSKYSQNRSFSSDEIQWNAIFLIIQNTIKIDLFDLINYNQKQYLDLSQYSKNRPFSFVEIESKQSVWSFKMCSNSKFLISQNAKFWFVTIQSKSIFLNCQKQNDLLIIQNLTFWSVKIQNQKFLISRNAINVDLFIVKIQ